MEATTNQPTLEGDFYSVERPWKARKTGQILFISIHPVKERDNRTESAEIDPWTLPYPSSLNQPALPSVYHHYYHKHTHTVITPCFCSVYCPISVLHHRKHRM